jgi:hypothetical protein
MFQPQLKGKKIQINEPTYYTESDKVSTPLNPDFNASVYKRLYEKGKEMQNKK